MGVQSCNETGTAFVECVCDSTGTGGTGSGGAGGSGSGGDAGSDGGTGGEPPLSACEPSIVEACGPQYDACASDCLMELANAQQCLSDVIMEMGYVTADDQLWCGETAAVNGAVITPEFNELYPCIVCNESTADECLGGFDDPPMCGG